MRLPMEPGLPGKYKTDRQLRGETFKEKQR
jgi:hypothetical protein